jgi:hypothetical protein
MATPKAIHQTAALLNKLYSHNSIHNYKWTLTTKELGISGVSKLGRRFQSSFYRSESSDADIPRERKKKVKELQAAKQEVPPILLVSIPNPKKTWLAKQEEMKLLQEQLRQQEEEVTFITNTVGDQSLQQDYTVYSIVFEIRPYYGRVTVRIVVLLPFAVRIKLIQYRDRTYCQ